MDAGQARREGHFKVVTDTIDQKTFPFPKKIVVMPDDGNARFGNQFCQSKTKRDIHWNRKSILDDQQFNIILLDECIKAIFEIASQFVNSLGDFGWTSVRPVRDICYCLNI